MDARVKHGHDNQRWRDCDALSLAAWMKFRNIYKRMAWCSALWLAMGSPAWAVDWRQVDANDPTLWYDYDSFDWDDEDYIYFAIFHGEWAGPEWMSGNAVSLSVDCMDGRFFVWNAGTTTWEESNAYPTTEALDDLAFDGCGFNWE